MHTQFLTSTALRDWNFGTLAQRLDLWSNAVIGDRILESLLPTGAGLAVGLLPCLVARRGKHWQAWGLAGVVLCAVMLFFNLYLVHDYYYIALYPATCGLLAMGVGELSGLRVARRTSVRMVGAIGTVAVLLLALTNQVGASELRQFAQSGEVPALSIALDEATAPTENVLTVGCDWDPLLLYFADRKGLMIRVDDPRLYPTTDSIRDYPVVVTCGPDPNRYLPAGYEATATRWSDIYRVTSTGR